MSVSWEGSPVKSHDFVPSQRLGLAFVLAVGAAAYVVGTAEDRDWMADIRRVGAMLLFAGFIRWAVRPIFISLRDIYVSAHQQGFDKGWQERGRGQRPVVVDLDEYRGNAELAPSEPGIAQ